MAVLGTALAKELLGFDDANKAFRPWWDTTQDFLMYRMVVLGTYIRLNISCFNMINIKSHDMMFSRVFYEFNSFCLFRTDCCPGGYD